MGTHGHEKWGQSIIGSVAGEVIRRCSRPVIVVRLPEHLHDLKKEGHGSNTNGKNTHKQAAWSLFRKKGGNTMKNDADNNQSMDLKERQFSLVLSDQLDNF